MSKSLAQRVSERLAPAKPPGEVKKSSLMLDAIREFRNAKTDEEAEEAFLGCLEISKLEVD
jgi:hypothetical protein